MGYDPMKSTWLNPSIQYLIGSEIIEYDLRDAGFNLIKQYKLLPENKIKELESLGKGLERHIEVGKLQRDDKEFSKRLTDKFAEIRTVFISANKLTDNDIISVKKDAIYTIGQVNKTKFGKLEFAQKNIYSSYIRLENINNLEIYYSSDKIDIKGMGENAINRHRLYMLEFIKKIFSMMESNNPSVRRYITRFIDDYKFHNLEDEYYIEFNNMSKNINPIYNYQNVILPLVQIIIKEIR